MNDDELRRQLKVIDDDPNVDVSSWEADFIENIVFNYAGPLSDKQREAAERIIDKYT